MFDDLDTEALLEVERLQEFHRRNAAEIRRFFNMAAEFPEHAEKAAIGVLRKIEGRSRAALPKAGRMT